MRIPDVFSYNRPSNLLAAWMKLRGAGVPVENIRFLPRTGSASLPEVTIDPGRDPMSDRVEISVNVGLQRRIEVKAGGPDEPDERNTITTGRLAHFLEPLLAGIPSHPGSPVPDAQPIDRFVSGLQSAFQELNPTVSPELRDRLDEIAAQIENALACDAVQRPPIVEALIRKTMDDPERAKTATALRKFLPGIQHQDPSIRREERQQVADDFLLLTEMMFASPTPEHKRQLRAHIETLAASEGLARGQQHMLQLLRRDLDWETEANCARCVRDLVEVVTTETFCAAAMCDMLWGVSYVNGLASELSTGAKVNVDGPVFTAIGGCDARSLLAILLGNWAKEETVLGVGPTIPAGQSSEQNRGYDLSVLTEAQREDLWNLVAWRRDAADPLVLLEIAARRFLHAGALVTPKRYEPVAASFGSLLGQIQRAPLAEPSAEGARVVDFADGYGGTAVLGGGLLTHPRAVLELPLQHDGGANAQRWDKTIEILRRLFIPVHLELEVVWQAKRAALDGATYLNHPFQRELRLRGDVSSE